MWRANGSAVRWLNGYDKCSNIFTCARSEPTTHETLNIKPCIGEWIRKKKSFVRVCTGLGTGRRDAVLACAIDRNIKMSLHCQKKRWTALKKDAFHWFYQTWILVQQRTKSFGPKHSLNSEILILMTDMFNV